MNIYRLKKLGMMGDTREELFYQSLEKAKKEYEKYLDEYRKSESLVKEGDTNYLSEPIVKIDWSDMSHRENIIYEHMIEVWYKCSYEYDGWDTTVESLVLERIEVA